MKRWLKIFYFIFLVSIIFAIIINFDEIKKIIKILFDINLNLILLIILLQLINFAIIAVTYKTILKALNYSINFIKLFNLSIVTISLNSIYPPMGLFGNIALFHSLKNEHKIQEGKILIMMILYLIALISSFLLILIFSLLFFIIAKKLAKIDMFLLVANTFLVITIALLLYAFVKNKKNFIDFLEKFLIKTFKFFKITWRKEKFLHILEEFYEGGNIIKKDKRHFLVPILFLLVKHFIDTFSIFLIFNSFGVKINILIVVFGIAIANVISLFSLIPGGIGVFEISMAASFFVLGIDVNIAIASVLVFRLVSYWLPILIGFFLYKSALKV
ncbi:flippase-like domain-containing protein [Candidatus Woesearchaeota archaeon]|nr:flippase-like domain-containing protein [Candidatus Woesearchaeota archaeon]